MPQVSLADAKAVDKFVGFDPGLPSFDPALSILRAFAWGYRRGVAPPKSPLDKQTNV
jgi:hypothetical protein